MICGCVFTIQDPCSSDGHGARAGREYAFAASDVINDEFAEAWSDCVAAWIGASDQEEIEGRALIGCDGWDDMVVAGELDGLESLTNMVEVNGNGSSENICGDGRPLGCHVSYFKEGGVVKNVEWASNVDYFCREVSFCLGNWGEIGKQVDNMGIFA